MPKLYMFIMLFTMLFAFGCRDYDSNSGYNYDDKQQLHKSQSANDPKEDMGVQMTNPFEDFSTLKEAEKKAGFELKLPKNIPADYKAINYRVLMNENRLIEVIYKNGNKEVSFRKGTLENISGVYTVFPQVESITFDNITVTLKGVGDKIQLAEWKNNSFLFSIYATEYTEKDFSVAGGLSKEQITAMVKDMLLK